METKESVAYRLSCKELEKRICTDCTYKDECIHADLPFTDKDLFQIWQIWCSTHTQLRTSFGGVVGLDYTAVLSIAKIFEWEITFYEMEGLQILELDMLKAQAEQIEKTRKE
jgi:hypothetical protein